MNSSTLLHGIEKVTVGKVKSMSDGAQYQEFLFIGVDGSHHNLTAYFPKKEQEKKS